MPAWPPASLHDLPFWAGGESHETARMAVAAPNLAFAGVAKTCWTHDSEEREIERRLGRRRLTDLPAGCEST